MFNPANARWFHRKRRGTAGVGGRLIGDSLTQESLLRQKPEVAPRKEKRAFVAWMAALVIVLIAALFIAGHVLHTQHPPVAPTPGPSAH